jgi:protocatechuate 3,4-dioxygenase beta subunit
MASGRLSRREILAKCAALGSLTIGSSLLLPQVLAFWEAQERSLKPTPWNEVGPFYKRRAPRTTHLRAAGDPGLPVAVSGQILDTSGNVLPGASVEVWHADHHGRYDIEGYRYRTSLVASESGKYAFDSVMPGHYPGRVCQHIHYLVTAPGHKALTTQLYFATDPVFEGDPDHNYTRDPLIQSRDLVRPVILTGDPKAIVASVTFEIVLERL